MHDFHELHGTSTLFQAQVRSSHFHRSLPYFPTFTCTFCVYWCLSLSKEQHQHDHHSHCHPPVACKAVVREDGGVRKEIAYMLLLIRVARTAVEMRSGVANSQSRLRATFTQLQSLAGRGGEARR